MKLLVCLAVFVLAGCSAIRYDHRDSIARSAIYKDKGVLDGNALSGALEQKFARVSLPILSLTAFVESHGGKCFTNPKELDELRCSIPQSSGFCIATRIDLLVTTNRGAISSISASQRADGC
jgi:hypothetical protein